MKRIRSLDGMRAISIMMVLINHAGSTMHSRVIHTVPFQLLADGSLGVKIFFVISGYLITKLLLIERKKTGQISLKDFYLRRIFRIFPVFYLYIIVAILLKCFFIPTLFDDWALVGGASAYLWNYLHLFNLQTLAKDNGLWFFGHFWSLAMEEQFYLIWPIMLSRINDYSLKKIVIGILLLMPFLRVATYFFMPDSRGQIEMMLQTGGNTIFTGCLGALIENTTFFKEKVSKIIYNKIIIFFIAIFLFVVSPLLFIYFKGAYKVPGSSLDNLCVIILLFWSVYVPSKISNFLNTKVMVQIGILSYSLYIWQQLFLTRRIHFWVNQFPQNLFVVFAVAFISYYLIEKPILRLKNRFVNIGISPVLSQP